MAFEIFMAGSDADIRACFPVFSELHPRLWQDAFLAQVRRQQAQSYQILVLRQQGIVKSVAGFRFAEYLAWGNILYIDDLAALTGETAQGFAGVLLDWLIEHVRRRGCRGLHLDSGYGRNAAHRFYLGKGLPLTSQHFSLQL